MPPLDEGELVQESEWMRVYRIGPKSLSYVSKFLSDGLQVSAESIKKRWNRMSRAEKEDFALGFSAKPQMTRNDEEILSFLMEVGSEIIWSRIAIRLVDHPERERVLAFLMERVDRREDLAANYVQALELIGDKSAVPCLRRLYDFYREETAKARSSTAPLSDWNEFMKVYDYLIGCRALFKLVANQEYEVAIKELLVHPDPRIQQSASRVLTT